jgi:hypothetical protein
LSDPSLLTPACHIEMRDEMTSGIILTESDGLRVREERQRDNEKGWGREMRMRYREVWSERSGEY